MTRRKPAVYISLDSIATIFINSRVQLAMSPIFIPFVSSEPQFSFTIFQAVQHLQQYNRPVTGAMYLKLILAYHSDLSMKYDDKYVKYVPNRKPCSLYLNGKKGPLSYSSQTRLQAMAYKLL